MMLKEKLRARRFERYWKKKGRKELFTWIHRYFRLHRELLVDSVYQNMYDYFRNTLIAYLKNNIKNKKMNDMELGELVDFFADIFNNDKSTQVNKCKPIIDELYKFWKDNSSRINEIRI